MFARRSSRSVNEKNKNGDAIRLVTVNDLVMIVKEFESKRSKNYSVYNAYDYYYGDASGVSFIEKIKAIRDQALQESKGKHAAFLSAELFVRYQQVILDKSLDSNSLAYDVLYKSYLGVSTVNGFIRDITERYTVKDSAKAQQKPYFLNLVNNVAKTNRKDFAWEALCRLERANITLTHDEMAMVLENRNSAMGLMMAFAEFSKTPNRELLVAIFAKIACTDEHPLAKHLEENEQYNHTHFNLHPTPYAEKALGIIGAIKVMSRAEKEFEVADLTAMLKNLNSAVEYAQAVRMLFSASQNFGEDSRKELLPKLRKNPERAFHTMAVTIHVRKLQGREATEKTCLTIQQLEELHHEDLAVLASLLRDLPEDLNTSANVSVLYDNIQHGAVLLPMLGCLNVRGIRDKQTTFNVMVNDAEYIATGSMALLPNLAENKMFDGAMLDKILSNPDYAEPLIKGLLIWCKAMQDTAEKRRGSLVLYNGDLQDSSRQLHKLMHDAKNLMYLHPERAAKIAQAAVVHPAISTPYKSLEDLASKLGIGNVPSYSPVMFRQVVDARVSHEEDRNQLTKSNSHN